MIRLRQASQITDINTKLAVLDQAATYISSCSFFHSISISSFSELGSHPWWNLQVTEQRLLLLKQREAKNVRDNDRTDFLLEFSNLVTNESNSIGCI